MNCFSVLDLNGVFYVQSSNYCFKRIRISRCLLSSQKLLYKTACSTALVFENRSEIFELIGSGFVFVDNFHSQFLV